MIMRHIDEFFRKIGGKNFGNGNGWEAIAL
jgi:hypothetical protein